VRCGGGLAVAGKGTPTPTRSKQHHHTGPDEVARLLPPVRGGAPWPSLFFLDYNGPSLLFLFYWA
jgi:hypothetical protein